MNKQQAIKAHLEQAIGQAEVNPLARAGAILKAALEWLSKNGIIDCEDVCDVAKQVWDSAVVPYNIPLVPEVLERRLEARAWELIEKAIHSACDHDHSDDEEIIGEV